MRSKIIAFAAIAVMALGAPAAASATTLIGSGSVAAQPVLQALFARYHQLHPNIRIIYTANGGNAGVKDVQQGRSQFAGQARLPLPSDAGTTYIKMYLDGLCMMVNPANHVTNMTIPKIRDVYEGVATNWSQVPGSQFDTTIDPIGRDTNGGTYQFFSQAVLNGQAPASNVNLLTSDGLVVNAVKRDKNAIGFASLAWQGPGLKTLKVNGLAPTPSLIKKLKYPLTRFIWLVVPTENPNKNVLRFADWARRSAAAGDVIAKAGGVPAFNKGH